MEENKIRSFTDLVAWKEAHKLVLMIYEETKKFPKEEIFGLTSQIRRAVISTSSNIAEGFSRRTRADKNSFYFCSQGSTTELQNQLLVARDVEYMHADAFQRCAQQSILVHKLVHGLIEHSETKPEKQHT